MKRLTRAEKAVLELSELNKLVFALREAGRKGGLWKEKPEERALRLRAWRESRAPYGTKR